MSVISLDSFTNALASKAAAETSAVIKANSESAAGIGGIPKKAADDVTDVFRRMIVASLEADKGAGIAWDTAGVNLFEQYKDAALKAATLHPDDATASAAAKSGKPSGGKSPFLCTKPFKLVLLGLVKAFVADAAAVAATSASAESTDVETSIYRKFGRSAIARLRTDGLLAGGGPIVLVMDWVSKKIHALIGKISAAHSAEISADTTKELCLEILGAFQAIAYALMTQHRWNKAKANHLTFASIVPVAALYANMTLLEGDQLVAGAFIAGGDDLIGELEKESEAAAKRSKNAKARAENKKSQASTAPKANVPESSLGFGSLLSQTVSAPNANANEAETNEANTEAGTNEAEAGEADADAGFGSVLSQGGEE